MCICGITLGGLLDFLGKVFLSLLVPSELQGQIPTGSTGEQVWIPWNEWPTDSVSFAEETARGGGVEAKRGKNIVCVFLQA